MNGSLALRDEKVKSYWQRGRAPIETPMPQILALKSGGNLPKTYLQQTQIQIQ